MIAALFVDPAGSYGGLPGVEVWGEEQDARRYVGPWPVVAHPPCKRWGRFWHGSPRRPHQFGMGEDLGCFAAALTAVRNHGGVLEHPAHSNAWTWFGLVPPVQGAGWCRADRWGRSCYVEQGHYGHASRKPTWLYAVGCALPELNWTEGEQRISPEAVARYGYLRARRSGVVGMVGGGVATKDSKRNATPAAFRDVLIGMARTVPPNYFEARKQHGVSHGITLQHRTG